VARIISLSPDAGRVHRLDGAECLLGRRLDCHIHINDQRVSRRHARVRREGDAWQLEDLGSCNGTFINGRRIQGAARLRHGDEVEIGASRFRMDLADDMIAAVESAAVLVPDVTDPALSPLIEVANLRQDHATRKIGPVPDVARELDRMQRKLQAMYKISETVASTLEPRALLDKVTGLLLEVFPQAQAAAAVTLDARTQQLRTLAARRRKGRDRESLVPNMSIPQNVVDRVLRQGQSVLLRAQGDPFASQPIDPEAVRDAQSAAGLRESAVQGGPIGPVGWRMGAPLSFRGEHLGILHVEADPAQGYFTQDDLDLLGGLASQAGVALHLIGLHQRLLARERLDYDLRLARQIQRNLLPRDPPRVTGLDFAVHYEPAFHVGGDFYDFLWLDPNKLALVVGDVSGKAISGALFMARVTSEIRAAAPVEASPRRVLQRVNRALSEVAEDGMFTTMVYVVIDLLQNSLRFANAGHTTPLLRRNGEVIPLEYVEARTMPLGVEVKIDVGEAQVQLLPGDTLMLYTDGIVEARSVNGEFYGQERLQQSFTRCDGVARTTLETVLSDLDRFVEEAPQSDDQTVVCITVNDASPRRFESILPTVMPPPMV
jgi:sigma-B regulation protein RsbU (phosphoserine phosphatase)